MAALALLPAADAQALPTLHHGDHGTSVGKLQRALHLNDDGVFGRGTLRASLEVPWTGQRIELGTRPYRAGDDVDFPLPEDINGKADGARVEVWVDGQKALLHLED